VQVREEKKRLLTLYAQLEARREATETHAEMLSEKLWADFIQMCEASEEMEDSEEQMEIDRLEFFQTWLLTSRRVRPGLCTITHALCFTLSLANLKA
jgi:hypothetical protein